MKGYQPVFIPVQDIQNVWLRRSAIVALFPIFALGGTVLVIISLIKSWIDFHVDLFVSAREQWRRKGK